MGERGEHAGAQLARVLREFEQGRLEEDELEGALAAIPTSADGHGETLGSSPPAGDLVELRRRLEMIHFNVCAAQRRGAILELLRDFRTRGS